MFFVFFNDGQGRNVDALVYYFGEDPSRYPFEQGLATETIILVCASTLESSSSLLIIIANDNTWGCIGAVTGTLEKFIRLFKKAHEENVEQAELEKMEAAKEARIKMLKGVCFTENKSS